MRKKIIALLLMIIFAGVNVGWAFAEGKGEMGVPDDYVELPLTGGSESCDCHLEFPWWLVTLLIISDLVVLWWFWPEKWHFYEKN